MVVLLHRVVVIAPSVFGTLKLAKALSLLALRMVLQLLPFLPIPNLLLLVLSTRAFVFGILNQVILLSVLRALMGTKIPSTLLHSHQMERTLFPEVWTKPSRCGNWLHLEAATLTMPPREDAVSKPSRVTRYVLLVHWWFKMVLISFQDFVLSVALTPDGNWVLSGSKDRGVQFWDPRTGNTQLMLQGHKNSVISVAPSPIGGSFATGSGDMRARIWSFKPYP